MSTESQAPPAAADPYEALDAAAVALLGPFMSPSSEGSIREALVVALAELAVLALQADLHAMSRVYTAVAEGLASEERPDLDPDERERIEAWAARGVGLAAGQLSPAEINAWAQEAAALPGVDASLLEPAVRASLVEECAHLARTRYGDAHEAGAHGDSPAADHGAAAGAPMRPGLEARSAMDADAPLLTAEEAELLAGAADGLARQLRPVTGASAESATRDAPLTGVFEVDPDEDEWPLEERLANLANAADLVGLAGLAAGVRRVASAAASMSDIAVRDESLRHWAARLSDWLRGPGEQRWLDLRAASTALSGGAAELESVRRLRIGKRLRDFGSDAEPLLRGADGAGSEPVDPSVLESMLREVPALAARLEEAIEAARAGDPGQFAEAGRIAHTLKGAANTAGATAIGALTHLLEDLLEACAEAGRAPDPGVFDALGAAADTIADMAEAAGAGAAPDEEALRRCAAGLTASLQAMLGESGRPPSGAAAGEDLDAVPTLDEPLDVSPESDHADWSPAAVARPVDQEGMRGVGGSDESVRIPAALVSRLMEAANDASIALTQIRTRIDALDGLATASRATGNRLHGVADELDRTLARVTLGTVQEHPDSGGDGSVLVRRLAECGADAGQIDQSLQEELGGLRSLVARLERIQSDVRGLALTAETLPVASIAPRLRRAARQAMRLAERPARFEIFGEELAFDRALLQSLIEPLGHLLRNAIDHGVEEASARRARGMPDEARVKLTFARDATYLRVRCEDDGPGFDLARIRARAVERGLLSASEDLPPWELLQFVFEPGFSTRRTAGALSGRGIGLDAVRQAVRELGGSVAIVPGATVGACVEVRVPILAGTISVMVARCGAVVLALLVRGVVLVQPELPAGPEGSTGRRPMLDEPELELVDIDALLALPAGAMSSADPDAHAARVLAIVEEPSGGRIGVRVPRLEQAGTVVVRPLPPCLAPIPGIIGAAVLGDGAVAPVVDLRAVLAARAWWSGREVRSQRTPRDEPVSCLVVDDSVSVRRATAAFLEDLGLRAVEAVDGEDALAKARERVPAAVIADLEMPRMDGLALVRALRADERTAHVPVIMITTRATPGVREQAKQAGVDVFLAKPFVEGELAARLRDCLDARHDSQGAGL